MNDVFVPFFSCNTFSKLLERPFRRRMAGQVEVKDSAASHFHDDEHHSKTLESWTTSKRGCSRRNPPCALRHSSMPCNEKNPESAFGPIPSKKNIRNGNVLCLLCFLWFSPSATSDSIFLLRVPERTFEKPADRNQRVRNCSRRSYPDDQR